MNKRGRLLKREMKGFVKRAFQLRHFYDKMALLRMKRLPERSLI